VNTLGR